MGPLKTHLCHRMLQGSFAHRDGPATFAFDGLDVSLGVQARVGILPWILEKPKVEQTAGDLYAWVIGICYFPTHKA